MAIALTCAVTAIVAQAQTFSVIHDFTGGHDGATPMAGLTMDRAGNLYGTANYGGNVGGNCGASGCGTVFRLTNHNSNWVFTPLYAFAGGNDGANPQTANVVIGPNGSLYQHDFPGRRQLQTAMPKAAARCLNLQPPPRSVQNCVVRLDRDSAESLQRR